MDVQTYRCMDGCTKVMTDTWISKQTYEMSHRCRNIPRHMDWCTDILIYARIHNILMDIQMDLQWYQWPSSPLDIHSKGNLCLQLNCLIVFLVSPLDSWNYCSGEQAWEPWYSQGCPIFFTQLNYVHKWKQNKELPPYFKLPSHKVAPGVPLPLIQWSHVR